MTIFRANPDRDFATIVNFDRNIFLKYHFRGRGESLSSISMSYYKTFNYWPMIWFDNYSDALKNPNVVPSNYPLLIRRPDRITEIDRNLCYALFDSWRLYPSALQAALSDALAKIKVRKRATSPDDALPAWAHWEIEQALQNGG
ncbi:hypothetical protein [Terrarubrum flagellatum]|uniref:hypothetical protein n=1 Tax=Terrirubrum flagellatum TaxID=2895980 RepID=UPI0031453D22